MTKNYCNSFLNSSRLNVSGSKLRPVIYRPRYMNPLHRASKNLHWHSTAAKWRNNNMDALTNYTDGLILCRHVEYTEARISYHIMYFVKFVN